jgi:metal-responsive CopG/Arc/MetJ family transcriptional regulator
MAHPSFTIPDELLDDFDRAIASKKAKGELSTNASRSSVVREFMKEYAEEELGEGNSNPKRMAGATN